MKKCTVCLQLKDFTCFTKRTRSKDGLNASCKTCRNEAKRKERVEKADKISEYQKKFRDKNKDKLLVKKQIWAANNKEKILGHQLKYHYDLSVEQYKAMVTAQNNKCAICNKEPKNSRLCVDHSHSTEEIRGLLCHKCNRAIGLLEENKDNFLRAITYLSRE